MNDLQKELEALKEKFAELEMLIKKEQNNDDEWPNVDNQYFAVTSTFEDHIEQITWRGDFADNHYWITGNCFRTQEEAEFHLERLKVMAELERLSDNDGKEFTDVWAIDEDGSNCFPVCSVNSVSTPYIFTNRIRALEAIKKIGEERLRKYWFGVKEENK